MARLTARQYHNSIADVFGDEVVPPAALEPDLPAHGLQVVGAATNSVSARGVEQWFEGARSIAGQLVKSDNLKQAILTCTPSGPDDAECLGQVVSEVGGKLWRRPLTSEEVDEIVAIGAKAVEALGTFDAALEYSLVKLLASPYFLYRIETGEDGRLTAYELATRLSFFLWNTTPDAALLAAAASEEILTDEGLDAQIERLLADNRSRHAVRNFFAEWLHLYDLDDLNKDPTVFLHFSTELGPAARLETLSLIEHLVFDEQADYRTLFVTRKTFVNKRLAAIYNVKAPKGATHTELAYVELPEDGPRAGLLGHVSFLGLHAHPVSSSATLRGVFLREAILCQDVPSPPSNTNTAIPEATSDAPTLRDRLLVHMEDPSCGVCHSFIDPPGFGLEQFDGIGRYRVEENGGTIDPTGEIDGVEFTSPHELYDAVANHPELPGCLAKTVYSYATGHAPTSGEKGQVAALTRQFEDSGFNVLDLIRAVARSEGFLRVAEVTP